MSMADARGLLPDLVRRAGPGPSWCRYQTGPWPVPHDALLDLSTTTPACEWLDQFGQHASGQNLANRAGARARRSKAASRRPRQGGRAVPTESTLVADQRSGPSLGSAEYGWSSGAYFTRPVS